MTNTIRGHIAQLFRLLIPYFKEHKVSLLIIIIGLLLQITLIAILPISYKYLFDEIAKHNLHLWLIVSLIFLMLGVFLYGSWADYVLSKMSAKICAAIQFNIYYAFNDMPLDSFKDATTTSNIINSFSIDIRNINSALITTLPQFFVTTLQIIVSYIIMFFFSPLLTLFMLLLLPLLIFPSNTLIPRTIKAEKQKDIEKILLINHIRESMFMHPIISAFHLQSFWAEKFKARMLSYKKVQTTLRFLILLSERILVSTANLLELLIIAIGVFTIIYSNITIGTWIGFFILAQNVIRAISRLNPVYSSLPEIFTTTAHLTNFLQEVAKQKSTNGTVVLQPFSNKIFFDNVYFAYTKNFPVLEKINFTINKGESIAIVGSSGSSKSTLLSLFLNFNTPTRGTISIDGHNFQSIDISSFRQQVAIILQDSYLFNMTIRDNIRMGKLHASDEEIIAAAKAAELHDTILSFPQGYDTLLIDQGTNLSGGQRQRIAIARALIRNPSILFGDEITASLDPQTEVTLNNTLMRLAKQRTYICITHQLNNVVTMDRIFVMDKGHLVEVGNHQELLALRGIYYQLWTKQHMVSISTENQNAQVSLELLRKIPLFQTLDDIILTMLATQLVMESYEENQLVFKQGDIGDKFYIIIRGIVAVKKLDSAGTEQTINTLETGDYFGEIALIKNLPRNASIYTCIPCIFLTLTQQKFLHIFNQSPALRAELEKIMALRI